MQQNSRIDAALRTPRELAAQIGAQAKRLRQTRQLRQADVAARARVSVATLQRFEATGNAAFSAVVRIANALGAEAGVLDLFALPAPQSIEALNAAATRRVRTSQ